MSCENSKICAVWLRRLRAPGRSAIVVLLAGFGAASPLLSLTGCATAVSRREAAAGFGSAEHAGQGRSWEVVLPAPDVAEMAEFDDPSTWPEFARADARLSAIGDQPITAASDWRDLGRPSLDDLRHRTIRDRGGRITYFGAPRDGSRRFRHPGWYPAW